MNIVYNILWFICFFFFSSRRRHTRYIGDWSSDVCSSDLGTQLAVVADEHDLGSGRLDVSEQANQVGVACHPDLVQEIGRASCRERVKFSVGTESLKQRTQV